MVSAQERDNMIQLFLNLRRETDKIKLPALNFTEELDSIREKMEGAMLKVEGEKEMIRREIENQKNILINTPVEVPVPMPTKKRWEIWK
jgi:hypothetical protein